MLIAVCVYKYILNYCNYVFQESDLMKLLFTIDPDTTPEFVTEIILTYVAEHFDSIKDMVSCSTVCKVH